MTSKRTVRVLINHRSAYSLHASATMDRPPLHQVLVDRAAAARRSLKAECDVVAAAANLIAKERRIKLTRPINGRSVFDYARGDRAPRLPAACALAAAVDLPLDALIQAADSAAA